MKPCATSLTSERLFNNKILKRNNTEDFVFNAGKDVEKELFHIVVRMKSCFKTAWMFLQKKNKIKIGIFREVGRLEIS